MSVGGSNYFSRHIELDTKNSRSNVGKILIYYLPSEQLKKMGFLGCFK